MHRNLALFCCLLLPLRAPAQAQPDCNKMLRDGDALMARKDPPLEEALRCYLNALNCNSQLAGAIGPKLQAVFDAIKKQKESEQQERQNAVEALEKSRRDQINKWHADATAFRKDHRFSDALRAYQDALELARTPAERAEIARQQTRTREEQTVFNFERNRNTGLALKAANDCHAALPYLKKALAARPGDPVITTAIKTCEQ